VIHRFRKKVMEVKKRRYVTFKNVAEDGPDIFSEAETRRILENLKKAEDT